METATETRYLIGVADVFRTTVKLTPELAEEMRSHRHPDNETIVANINDLLAQGITTVPAYIRLDDILGDDMYVEDRKMGRPGARYYWAPEGAHFLIECPRLLPDDSFFIEIASLDLPEFDEQTLGLSR